MLDKMICYFIVATSILVGLLAINDGFTGHGKGWIVFGCLVLSIGGLAILFEKGLSGK